MIRVPNFSADATGGEFREGLLLLILFSFYTTILKESQANKK
jgi:hypothetical protein